MLWWRKKRIFGKVEIPHWKAKSWVENENIKNNLKHANKTIKTGDKEVTKMSTKIDNLEAITKNLKQQNRDLTSERTQKYIKNVLELKREDHQ